MGLIAIVLIPVAMFYLFVGWFGFFGWIMAPLCYLTGRHIRGGLWLCMGIYGVQFYFGEGQDYTPLFELVMGISCLGALVQFLHNRRTLQAVAPPEAVPEATMHVAPVHATGQILDLIRNKHGVYVQRR